ncbi:MAG: aldolase/citrate lyase family protein [Agriterribacter sp.]
MKTAALELMRKKLAAQQAVYGIWITLESPSITEIAVHCGLDWIVIDAEHGHLDWHNITEHIRAAVRSNTVVLVRISHIDEGIIKRVLDIGADGIVVPHVETVDDWNKALAYARYPPNGIRGIGAERATKWGSAFAQHVADADKHLMMIPIIESVKGGKNIDEIIGADNTEIIFFGPADYSASAGHAGEWEGKGIAETINDLKDKIIAAGKNCGVMIRSKEDRDHRYQQGFRMLAIGTDAGLILKTIHSFL